MKYFLMFFPTIIMLSQGLAQGTQSIGEHFEGGIVFYVDSTGRHGLIAADSDQGTRMRWSSVPDMLTNATVDGIGEGAVNTRRIVGVAGSAICAASICAAYHGGGYKDWYLPSKYELKLLYQQRSAVGGFVSGPMYWSSTEYSNSCAWAQSFYNGFQFSGLSKTAPAGCVRAVKAF